MAARTGEAAKKPAKLAILPKIAEKNGTEIPTQKDRASGHTVPRVR